MCYLWKILKKCFRCSFRGGKVGGSKKDVGIYYICIGWKESV